MCHEHLDLQCSSSVSAGKSGMPLTVTRNAALKTVFFAAVGIKWDSQGDFYLKVNFFEEKKRSPLAALFIMEIQGDRPATPPSMMC